MKLKFSGTLKNVKPGIEWHGENRHVRQDLSISTIITDEQLIELLGTGSEDLVHTLWTDDGRAAGVLASGNNELTLDPCMLKVDCDIVSKIKPVELKNGKAKKFSFNIIDGSQVELTFQYSNEYKRDHFDYMVQHGMQVKDKDLIFTLEGQQAELDLSEEDKNPTQPLDLDNSDSSDAKPEHVVSKEEAEEKGFRTEPPPPPPPPAVENEHSITDILERAVNNGTAPEAQFNRFVEGLKADHEKGLDYMAIVDSGDLVISFEDERELHIGTAIDGDHGGGFEVVAIRVGKKLHEYKDITKPRVSTAITRFIADFLNEEVEKSTVTA